MIEYLSEWFDVKYVGWSLSGKNWILYPKSNIDLLEIQVNHEGVVYQIEKPEYIKITNWLFIFNEIQIQNRLGSYHFGNGEVVVTKVKWK